jgi:DNA gyrase/topoisomerase IV subunit A
MGQDGLYRLSDTQAQEILQMRLQRLTGLEQDKIVAEYRESWPSSKTCWTSWPSPPACPPSSATN